MRTLKQINLIPVILLVFLCSPVGMQAQGGGPSPGSPVLAPQVQAGQALDSDGDGISDEVECPAAPCRDTDGDGIPAYLDPSERIGQLLAQDMDKGGGDSDLDGIPDHFECPGGTPCPDSDSDGIPDYFDPDLAELCGTPSSVLSYFDGNLVSDVPAAGDQTWYQLPLLVGDALTFTFRSAVDAEVVAYAPYIDPETGLTTQPIHDPVGGYTAGGVGERIRLGVAELTPADEIADGGRMKGIGRMKGSARMKDIGGVVDSGGNMRETIRFSAGGNWGWYCLWRPSAAGSGTFELTWQVEAAPYEWPATDPLPDFATPPTEPGVETLVVTHGGRLAALYPGQGATIVTLMSRLASNPNARVLDLDTLPGMDAVYSHFPAFGGTQSAMPPGSHFPAFGGTQSAMPPGSHFLAEPTVAAANYASMGIDKAIETHAAAYPNLKNIVLVGSDSVIPLFRIYDETRVANEGEYLPASGALPGSAVGRAYQRRYYFSDAPYAAAGSEMDFIGGRSIHLPDYRLGRLVETPGEMLAATEAYLADPTLSLEDGLVVGYEFLNDLAGREMVLGLDQGLSMTPLIGDVWTADDLEVRLFTTPHAPDLANINGHFRHYKNIAADTGSGTTTAGEALGAASDFAGGLYMSVGCHAGLSVPDEQSSRPLDFAQVFVGRGGVWAAATAYAYGDSDLVAYSERLNLRFMQALQDGETAGDAFVAAKREYFQEASSLSIYDEKGLQTFTLYGFPMYVVDLPGGYTPPSGPIQPASGSPGRSIAAPAPAPPGLASQMTTITPSLSLTTTARGAYYQAAGEVAVQAGQPVQPQVTTEAHLADSLLHGVLWLGGVFTETTGFDPLVAGLTVDEDISGEPDFDAGGWAPPTMTISRLGDEEHLVTVAGQFDAVGNRQRTYSQVLYQTYHAPLDETDFTPPEILVVSAEAPTVSVRVSNQSGVVRVPVLWRAEGASNWHLLDLQNTGGDTWSGALPRHGPVYYLVQAVDGAGNVAFVHDWGYEFRARPVAAGADNLYLPIILK